MCAPTSGADSLLIDERTEEGKQMDPNSIFLINGGIEDHQSHLREDWRPVHRARRRHFRIPRVRRPHDDELAS
jgi:hypothetical protein